MKVSKKNRKIIFEKYKGRCAYCGDSLQKGWHVDEIEPIVRNQDGTCKYPERFHIDNQVPTCPSCNINKHSMSLESFRNLIKGFMKRLNNQSTQYKIAKRYGLVNENDIQVKFYFELEKM